jgi:hypothetical protein
MALRMSLHKYTGYKLFVSNAVQGPDGSVFAIGILVCGLPFASCC